MWCNQCRQDVPAVVANGEKRGLSCPRCANQLHVTAAVAAAEGAQLPTDDPPSSPPEYDGWELDEQLSHIQRVLRPDGDWQDQTTAACRRELDRLDPAHASLPGDHAPPARPPRVSPVAADQPPQRSSTAALTWTALSLGTMALVCGGVLLVWSALAERPELWTVGLPIALGGQIGLLVGLCLQLERLWHDSRRAAAKLDDVDEQLHDLKNATTLLGSGDRTPGGAFYAHLADRASPQLLLSDLKSQLDLLAVRIMQQK